MMAMQFSQEYDWIFQLPYSFQEAFSFPKLHSGGIVFDYANSLLSAEFLHISVEIIPGGTLF